MKIFSILVSSAFLSFLGHDNAALAQEPACPNLSGYYIGTCQITYAGQSSNSEMGFGVSQKDCNMFLFNEGDLAGNPRYFVDGQSTLYKNGSRQLLRRASVFDNNKSIVLNETLKDGDNVSESIHILRLMPDGSLSIESETFDMTKAKLFGSAKCTSLNKN